MLSFYLRCGASVLAACLLLVHTSRAAKGAENDVRLEIQRALERTRAAINAVEMDLQISERFCRGSYNEMAGDLYPNAPAGAVPPEDIVLDYTKSMVLDFNLPRGAGKGYRSHPRLILGENGVPTLDVYTEWSQGASDGTYSYTLTPKSRLDARSIPDGIKHPVEFVKMKVAQGSASAPVGRNSYAIHFWAGALVAPGQQITRQNRRPMCDLSDWKVQASLRLDDEEVVVLTSRPTERGEYYEYYLAPRHDYRPTRWVAYSSLGAREIIKISYAKTAGGPLGLASWTVQGHYATGALATETNHVVTRCVVNPSLSDEQFTLKPTDGMVVEDIDRGNITGFHVAGRPELKAETNYRLNADIDQSKGTGRWSIILGGGIAVLVCGLGAVVLWRRSKRSI